MQILHYNNIDFNIDPQGVISRTGTWHVMPANNVLTAWEGFAGQVRTWAGKIGDPWRAPGNDSQSYTADNDYVITAIRFKALSRYMYEVEFSGAAKNMEAEQVGEPEIKVNESGEKEKSAVWRIHAEQLTGFLPKIGDPIRWAGELYLCSSINCEPAGGKVYKVTLQAKDMSVLMIGNPTFAKTRNLEKTKKAKWRVNEAALPEFLSAHDVNAAASEWAGDGYYVSAVDCSPVGKLGYYVTIEARHVGIRMIDIRREVKFEGYSASGAIVKETVYSGRWQVHADSCGEFNQKIAQSAAEWAEDNFTVVAINTNRISEVEYEYTLEAKNINETSEFKYVPFVYDPRDSLSTRRDYQFFTEDFFVHAKNAGWTTDEKGLWVKMNSVKAGSWDPKLSCPFKTTAELDKSFVDVPLQCVCASETFYRKGLPGRHTALLKAWKPGSVVASVGGYNGSWKQRTQQTGIVMDDKKAPWTKIERQYIAACDGYEWNSQFRG